MARKRLRHVRVLLYLLGVGLSAAAASAQSVVDQSPIGQRSLALVESTDGYRIDAADGVSQHLPVIAATRFVRIRELRTGWLAAGSSETNEGGELVLVEQRGRGVQQTLPNPGDRVATYRANPVPLVDRGQLVGLAWLEGDDGERNALRVASWNGAWATPATVVAAGEHALLALTGTVLDDGRWLLVWAAVDGQDDEIYWTVQEGAGWTPATRVAGDNDVPDILPRVTVTSGGALLAWSSFDGADYRLRLARFDGDGWAPIEVASEKGSLYPRWKVREDDGRALLSYAAIGRSRWTVLDIESSGRVAARAHFPQSVVNRPTVVRESTGAAVAYPTEDGTETAARTQAPWTVLP